MRPFSYNKLCDCINATTFKVKFEFSGICRMTSWAIWSGPRQLYTLSDESLPRFCFEDRILLIFCLITGVAPHRSSRICQVRSLGRHSKHAGCKSASREPPSLRPSPS